MKSTLWQTKNRGNLISTEWQRKYRYTLWAKSLATSISYLYEPNDDLAELIRLAGHLPAEKVRSLIKHLGNELT